MGKEGQPHITWHTSKAATAGSGCAARPFCQSNKDTGHTGHPHPACGGVNKATAAAALPAQHNTPVSNAPCQQPSHGARNQHQMDTDQDVIYKSHKRGCASAGPYLRHELPTSICQCGCMCASAMHAAGDTAAVRQHKTHGFSMCAGLSTATKHRVGKRLTHAYTQCCRNNCRTAKWWLEATQHKLSAQS